MKLFVNLTARALVASATDNTRLGTLAVKQGDVDTLDLVLLTETGNEASPLAVTALPAGFTQIRLGARTKADLTEDDLLFSAVEFEVSGSGDSRIYSATLHLDTESIAAKFPDEDEKTVALEALLDMELLSGDETVRRTVLDQWPVSVRRDIFRDTEGVPNSGNPMLRAIWMPGIVGLTGGGATKLDGITTEAERDFTSLVMINDPHEDGISVWELQDSAITRDVVAASGATTAEMDSTGLVADMTVDSYDFAPGTTIIDIYSPGEDATVEFSTAKLSSGTAPVTFRYNDETPTPDTSERVYPDDFDPESLGGVWVMRARLRKHGSQIRSASVVCAAQQYLDVTFAEVEEDEYVIASMTLRYTGVGTPPYIIAAACVSDKTDTGFRVWFTADTSTDFTFDYTISV